MASTSSLILYRLERVLPWLIVFPFGYFVVKRGYPKTREAIVNDAKNGRIKNTFLKFWLKDVALDRVILQSKSVRQESLTFLEHLVGQRPIQNDAYRLVVNTLNHQEAISAASKASGLMFNTIMNQSRQLLINTTEVESRHEIEVAYREKGLQEAIEYNYDSVFSLLTNI